MLTDEQGNPHKHEVFNFGKYKGWDVAEILAQRSRLLHMGIGQRLTYNTKQVLTRIRLREFNKKIKSCSQLSLGELFFKELRNTPSSEGSTIKCSMQKNES